MGLLSRIGKAISGGPEQRLIGMVDSQIKPLAGVVGGLNETQLAADFARWARQQGATSPEDMQRLVPVYLQMMGGAR